MNTFTYSNARRAGRTQPGLIEIIPESDPRSLRYARRAPRNRATRRAHGRYLGFVQSNARKVAPFDWDRLTANKPWWLTGGYSPDGDTWGCPFTDCGFGIAGLNSPPDDDEFASDFPVWEHLHEAHADEVAEFGALRQAVSA